MKDLASRGLTMIVVTHEMRFARDASSRVFYMDRGELWEAGPPEQIFVHPQRQETYDFVFRVRTWDWRIDDVDFDFPAMEASLETFCARQFLGRHTANELLLAIEELSTQCLIPIARDHGINDPSILYTVSVAEGAEKAQLKVDCGKLSTLGIDFETMQGYADKISSALLEKLLSEESVTAPGVMTCTIGWRPPYVEHVEQGTG